MPFCHSPWTNIDVSPQGDIAPCCKFIHANNQPQFNIKTHSLEQYTGSNFLNEIKQQFNDNQWPVGCERCKIEETHNIKSKRILDLERWKSHYDVYEPHMGFITASIAFGNTCNLKCITCSPHSSSRWESEYKKITGQTVKHFRFYKNNFVDNFISYTPNLVHLDVPGGEPFLSGTDEQKKLLQHYIDSGRAADITIHYTTNATIFPDNSWWDLWQQFKEIDLQLSIDGLADRYQYIRYPANWNLAVNSIVEYIKQSKIKSNIKLSVSHTVSAYNIYYLDEFVSWCYNIGLPTPWLSRLHFPKHMRPTVWPENIRTLIAEHLKTSTDAAVQIWADILKTEDDSAYFEMFMTRTQQHDEYRNTDFSTTFPELTRLIRKQNT
jgi:radical SAM protein with 4Fe4S-binding SPASM domain